MYQEMVDLLQRLYTPKTTSEIFPYGRMRSVPAPQLAMWESCRNEFQLWSPSLRKFITVAAVSKSNDFISKRLMIKHSGGHHVHMVHGYVADVTKLIACLLEQSQTKNGEVNLPLFQSFVEIN
ncbi:uncharacterized protein LOC106166204 [Lingula anatina]|uniref:Uncharacterized protein LOC106166204 n=1 Tax=Lingula anatina TaxID=7574 RepID=A0A1S3IQE9_LINAN|nr:uncharacterized protein LOC106166204 [Lingula anatina]|eukprot:XP_013400136.1 uncharacterized protein LOC106166204 [Lingula anatina]